MTIAREAVYAALFAKLDSLRPAHLTTTSRTLRHIADLGDGELPAAYQVQTLEQIRHQDNLPPVYTFMPQWYLYVGETDPTVPPSIALNNLTDLLEGTLTPDWVASLTQTLGLQVHRVWVSGPIDIYEGVQEGRAIAIIPLSITVAGSNP